MGCFADNWEDHVARSMRRVIVVDTETGGLDPEQDAVLEIALVCGEREFNVKIHSVSGRVSHEALAYNGIDIDAHNNEALMPDAAWLQVKTWVDETQAILGGDRPTLCWHNVGFDVGFVQRLYKICTRPVPGLFTTYRVVDTHTMLWERTVRGALPVDCVGLDSALKHYGIACGARHTALGDAKATQRLLAAMLGER